MKKIIAAILVALMVLSLITACAPGGQKLAVGYEDTGSDHLNYYYRDRDYALTADQMDTTKAELDKASAWLNDYVLNSVSTGKCAYDFLIGEESFSSVLSSWERTLETANDNDTQTDYVLTYTKEGNPLVVTVYATAYKQYAIIEWTVWIENKGVADSAMINELYGIKAVMGDGVDTSGGLLTRFYGSTGALNAFSPETRVLDTDSIREFGAVGGKASEYWSPYFNLQWNNEKAKWGKEGIFVSVGWPGQWIADVTNTGAGYLIEAKQEWLNTYLKPGEKVRSPLMTLLFWEQDFLRCQNLWRRWVYNIAMPQPDGKPIPTTINMATAEFTSLMQEATTENQISAINKRAELGIDYDLWLMDAGWYPHDNGNPIRNDWFNTGDWNADSTRFENGSLKSISDAVHANGKRTVLWFEPERVFNGSPWDQEFKGTGWLIENTTFSMLDLSRDDVTDFLIEFIIGKLREYDIDIYRQDCNFGASLSLNYYWKKNDAENREGLTENKYLVNYLRYYDAILEETGTFIDSCATGGRRLDLETVKRSAPLWRDDYCTGMNATQCHSYGINLIMPFSGANAAANNKVFHKYATRSALMQSANFCGTNYENADEAMIDLWRNFIDEFRTYSPYLTKDYYPLSPFSTYEGDWLAWQYHDPEKGDGIIQVFKRVESTENEQAYYLCGLDPDTTYVLEDIDTGEKLEATGRALMCDGITVGIYTEIDAKIFRYAPVSAE